MPSLPTKISRRKHATPIAIFHENDVWHRSFKLMGLQPVHSSAAIVSDMMASAEAVTVPASEDIEPPLRKLTLEDLPREIQRDIFKWSSSTDLIALSLVSRHFRDVAAAQLYRNFHIVFPDEDDPSYESPIDGLAGGLDTFVTSEYDYSQYLREIVLDTLSGGSKGERAYRHYTYDLSCGKFMNTLFLLTLRKAKALKTFKWDLRVELSRPVFRALHQIPSLQNVHVRMQAGSSIYEIPPPLPSLIPFSEPTTTIIPPPPGVHGPPLTIKSFSHANRYKSKSPMSLSAKEPPTFSGFKNLKSLAVLDMDTLDYVTEIKACLRASSSTLNKLKLSFSENLARQARKPPPADDTGDESEEIDEFGNMMPPPPPPPLPSTTDDASGPAKAFRAQEEKKVQEAVLGRIFGLESYSVKQADGGLGSGSDEDEKVEEEYDNAGKNFIKDLTNLSKKLMIAINGPGSRTQQQKEALEIIEKAARKYVETSREEAKEKAAKKNAEASAIAGASAGQILPASGSDKNEGDSAEAGKDEGEQETVDTDGKTPELFTDSVKKIKKSKDASVDGANPDDINVEEPETVMDVKEFEESAQSDLKNKWSEDLSAGSSPQTSPKKKIVTDGSVEEAKFVASRRAELKAAQENYSALKGKLAAFVREAETLRRQVEIKGNSPETGVSLLDIDKNIVDLQAKVQNVQSQLSIVNSDVADLQQRTEDWPQTSKDKENQRMSEYIRETRGLALKTLAIYLIPIKASVLSRAVDLHVLKRITLLNVGSQVSFWNLLTRENKASPLPLRKIHTDNVSVQFVQFVSQLEALTELFILERSSKVPEYSFAPKTVVTMDHIRKFILKKHAETLKKLMIKNENDYTWDANEQVIKLLCKKGKQLEELALSFGVRTVHTFNQYFPGLVKLRAMHIINFRNDDTCHWVIREIRKFAIDNVSHNPEMKLEYIAVDGTVERLVRRAKKPRSKGKEKAVSKGKGKAISSVSSFPTLDTMLAPPPDFDASSDESEESDEDLGPGLKLETLEGVRFYDIYGVRMWRKDIMLGRL